jgi:acyl-ACP thioesterase
MRPVRPQPIFEPYPLAELGEAIAGEAVKIGASERECSRELQITARYSDLDQNDHVNNTSYVRWFLDCYRPEEITPSGRLRFAVNYLQAASYGDLVRLCRQDGEAESTVHGYLDSGAEAFSAQIWRI